MLIVSTAVPGTIERIEFEKFGAYARERGVDVKVHHLGEEIFRVAKERRMDIRPDNILDVDNEKLDLARMVVLERIAKQILNRKRKKSLKHIDILRTHAKFTHDDIPMRAWFSKDILALNPDMFITFVGDSEKTLDNLNLRKQWAKEDFSLGDILYWVNDEVNTTHDWAVSADKPFRIIPVTAPHEFFFRAICRPDIEMVYASMPLTHAYDNVTQKKVDELIRFLEKYFNVIDPRWIDPLAASKGQSFDRAVYNNIVNRDLEWFVRQSSRVIGYFPKVVLSSGLIAEITNAFKSTKDTWLIWPKGQTISPFSTKYARKVFYTMGELKRYVKENFKEVG